MQPVSWLSFQYKHNVIHQFHSLEEVKYNFLPSTAWVSSLIKSSFLHDDCSFLKHTFHPLTPTLIKFQYNLVPSPSPLPIFPLLQSFTYPWHHPSHSSRKLIWIDCESEFEGFLVWRHWTFNLDLNRCSVYAMFVVATS